MQITDEERLKRITEVDKLAENMTLTEALKEFNMHAKQYYEWKHRLGLMRFTFNGTRTEDLVIELMKRTKTLVVGLETTEGTYIVRVKGERATFTTLMMLIDLQNEKGQVDQRQSQKT